ncbi:unnamed protein product [Didymodactylos carnosus]|uniref:Uncharacterized protein n=1 Tax=Didymodactylos carnosus TaxID=1234261 RepID=A0A814SP60_9BILA|nr:unnamed protein product [Didymodactylos carnosus]CAF1309970.1 unnamed protein product [Didymodactylos carnosus]CAF3912134.1 unnamed protein product [Didymodactylos carnosus]CAF4117763.1 unnamed protein product [Didymodactylos carnosus]
MFQSFEESLVERDELDYPNASVYDIEPDYKNFTAVQNAIVNSKNNSKNHVLSANFDKTSITTTHRTNIKTESKSQTQRSHSQDDSNRFRAVRVDIQNSTVVPRHHSVDDLSETSSVKNITALLNVSSKIPNKIYLQIDNKQQQSTKDGYIFNLLRIMNEMGINTTKTQNNNWLDYYWTKNNKYNDQSKQKNVSALLDIVLKMGGANGPLTKTWKQNIDEQWFEKWYEKRERSASMNKKYSISNLLTQERRNDVNYYHKTEKNDLARTKNSNAYFVVDRLVFDNQNEKQKLVHNTHPYMANEMEDNAFRSEINKMYGFDDLDGTTSESSYASRDEIVTNNLRSENTLKENRQQKLPSLTTSDYYSMQNDDDNRSTRSTSSIASDMTIKTNHRESPTSSTSSNSVFQQYHYPRPNDEPLKRVTIIERTNNSVKNQKPIVQSTNSPQSSTPSSFQPSVDYFQTNLNQYAQNDIRRHQLQVQYNDILNNNPELNNDPNPNIIYKKNPNHVTYQQNIGVRYLVPPTPPPPGPIVIRGTYLRKELHHKCLIFLNLLLLEVLSPKQPTPPPIILKYRDPSPKTPPPLIIREEPPLVPPINEEPTILTKIVPPTPQKQRIIIERLPAMPPKPQQVIIEKWLPYKPQPPRQVIYERLTENNNNNHSIAQFEPSEITDQHNIAGQRQRRHSFDCWSKSASTTNLFDANNTRTITDNSTHTKRKSRPHSVDHFVDEIYQDDIDTNQVLQKHRTWNSSEMLSSQSVRPYIDTYFHPLHPYMQTNLQTAAALAETAAHRAMEQANRLAAQQNQWLNNWQQNVTSTRMATNMLNHNHFRLPMPQFFNPTHSWQMLNANNYQTIVPNNVTSYAYKEEHHQTQFMPYGGHIQKNAFHSYYSQI